MRRPPQACRHADTADRAGSNLAVHNSRQKGVSCARGGGTQEVDDEVDPRERRRVIRLVLALALALALLDLEPPRRSRCSCSSSSRMRTALRRSARPVNAARAAPPPRIRLLDERVGVDRRASVAATHGVRQSGQSCWRAAPGVEEGASHRMWPLAQRHRKQSSSVQIEHCSASPRRRRGAPPPRAPRRPAPRGDCRRCRTDRRRGIVRRRARSAAAAGAALDSAAAARRLLAVLRQLSCFSRRACFALGLPLPLLVLGRCAGRGGRIARR